MKKPNRKDFPNNRNGSSRYNAAVRKYNTFVKNKNKPVNKDPRPKIGDFPNREAYRQQVLKWNERRKAKIETERNKDSRLTSRGRKPIKTKTDLKVNKDKSGSGLSNIPAEEGSNKKFNPDFGKKTKINKDKPENKKVDKKKVKNEPYVDPDKADKEAEKNFRSSSSVEEAKQKSDPLRKYRRGGDTGRKETRITKKLKKAGFTSDRLAKLRKKNAEFQKAKKGGKEAMKAYRKKYPKRG